MKLGTETGSTRDFSVIGLYMMLLRRLVARELWNLSPSPVSSCLQVELNSVPGFTGSIRKSVFKNTFAKVCG